MYFSDSDHSSPHQSRPPSPSTCTLGHRSSLILATQEGGSICLVCLSNLISSPESPTIHVSYALSQLSRALSQPPFLQTLLTYHTHFLISPLVQSLSSSGDEPIANQTIDLITELCSLGGDQVYGEFLARVSERLSSRALAWNRRQFYTLHCLGILLDHKKNFPSVRIRDKDALFTNLVAGLQLPSEDIRGEIFFVLYKMAVLQYAQKDEGDTDIFSTYCPILLHLSLEALTKTESDDVRLNCVALLMMLAKKGFFDKGYFEAPNFMQTETVIDGPPQSIAFAEAIKGPLLSSDSQVQSSTLDLIFLYLSLNDDSTQKCRVLVEENIADYVLEILRLSGCRDPVINSCLQVLDLLSTAEQAFRQRIAIGFTTLVPVLHHVAEIPFHPAQLQTLKLILNCVANCPGLVSNTSIEEIGHIVTRMLKRHIDGDIGMLPEAFNTICSILVALMKSPSSSGASNLAKLIQDASNHAILSCLGLYQKYPFQLLYSLYLLKEAYEYSHEANTSFLELKNCILHICQTHILPWFVQGINEMDEDIILGVFETFQSILVQVLDNSIRGFTDALVSSSLFSHLFGCLGLFPTEKMKCRVYLMLSCIVDVILGNDLGKPIKDAASHLPTDPIDLLFLLGQKSSDDVELRSCQSAVLLILHTSSLYNDRIADEKMVLASLEQYILLNNCEFLYGAPNSGTMEMLINLYGLYRSLAKISYQIPYSPEAERIFFHLLAEKKWNIFSTRIHFASLKWLFEQEKISKYLSNQILEFCRYRYSFGDIVVHGNNSQTIDMHEIAALVTSGDNFAAILYVCLLRELVEGEVHEQDIISVLNTIAMIIDLFPAASDQLCLHGIGSAIQNLCYHTSYSDSPQLFLATSRLAFNILGSVHSESLSDGEAWVAITMNFMDHLIQTVAPDGWTQDGLLVIGILCLILHHSTNQSLVDASKIILLSRPLVSSVNSIIQEACSKGPALVDYEGGTRTEENLTFTILLLFFSSISLHAVLPGTPHWQDLLDYNDDILSLPYIRIKCHDLCRLMYFGSPPLRLVASYCLLVLFSRISIQSAGKPVKPKCSEGYLASVVAVLEVLIFYSDIRVAVNSALCLSLVLEWENPEMGCQIVGRNNWCRLIIEEMAMSLAASGLASKSFMIHHKPAVYVAVAMLNLQNVPDWMSSLFDDSCVSGIISNLSAGNLSVEIALLFRTLLSARYLKADQITSLNRVFQACRNHLYMDDSQEASTEESIEKTVFIPQDFDKIPEFLINLVASQSNADINSMGSLGGNKNLLEEIDLFSKGTMGEDNG